MPAPTAPFESLGQLPMPLADLRPDRVTQLILRVRRYRHVAILVGEQESQDQSRFECRIADAVPRPDRHAVVLTSCDESPPMTHVGHSVYAARAIRAN